MDLVILTMTHNKSCSVTSEYDSQKVFLKGRFIEENTRMMDVLDVAQDKYIPGMILLIDFEKTFGSLAWKFKYNILRFLTMAMT